MQPTQPEQAEKPQIPQHCPVWSANFRALQTQHTNLSTEAQTQLTNTLSQQLTAKEKLQSLQPIVKKLEKFAKKLESTYQKILFNDISPEHRELIETDLLPQYRHWLKQSHKNPEPINPAVQPKFCGFDLLQYDESTDRYFYEGGKTHTVYVWGDQVNEESSDTPATIELYKKFAGRRFSAPTEANFIARIKPCLASIQAMKKEFGAVKVAFSCIANSVRANAAIIEQERVILERPEKHDNPASWEDEWVKIIKIDPSVFMNRMFDEGTSSYYGDLEFNESGKESTITMKAGTGQSMDQLVEQTNGYLLTISPGVTNLPADPAVIFQDGKSGEVNYEVTMLKKYWEQLKKSNRRALSPHEAVTLLQSRVAEGSIRKQDTFTALLGVSTNVSFWYLIWAANTIHARAVTNDAPSLRLGTAAAIF